VFPHLKRVFYPDPSKAGWQHPLLIEKVEVPWTDTYREQLNHFCRVVAGEETPRTAGEDAKKTLPVTLAILKSAETGQPINLD
jgi:predicted dehydrogenase